MADRPKWDVDVRVKAEQETGSVFWHLPEEAPVALVYNGQTFAVMLATPADLQDYAVGFSLSEDIADSLDDIKGIELHERAQGIDLHVTLSARSAERLALRSRRRNIEGRTGCGLCGVDSAERLFEPLPKVAAEPIPLNAAVVARAAAAFDDLQPMRALNKSVHGAAWVSGTGEVHLVREDVGRHNAMDKLLGALAKAGMDMTGGFILMTSRASYEIVEKAARRGVRALVTYSAPTAFAVRRAAEANLTLANWSADTLTIF